MSSDYEKFWQQIDTLKSDLVAEKALVRFYTEAHRLVKEDNTALKAENERLLEAITKFTEAYQPGWDHHGKAEYKALRAAMKDFSTQPKEEQGRKETLQNQDLNRSLESRL